MNGYAITLVIQHRISNQQTIIAKIVEGKNMQEAQDSLMKLECKGDSYGVVSISGFKVKPYVRDAHNVYKPTKVP